MRPPRWWREVVLLGLLYGGYTLTRNTLPAHEARARANALDVYRAEQHLHVDIERSLNGFASADLPHWLIVFANYTYSIAHPAVTLGVLVWLYVAHPQVYRPARTILLATTLLGLVGYWLYPLAPPRFFPALGYVDTVVQDDTWGSWASTTVTSMSNQFAAMPSIHQAWSIWAGLVVVLVARPTALRVLGATYPVAVFFIIVATANHWTLDAVAGLAALAVAIGLWAVGRRAGDLRPWRFLGVRHSMERPAPRLGG